MKYPHTLYPGARQAGSCYINNLMKRFFLLFSVTKTIYRPYLIFSDKLNIQKLNTGPTLIIQ